MRLLVHRLGSPTVPDDHYLARFRAELSHDLNIPRALAVAWELLKSSLPDGVKRATIARFDDVLGLQLDRWQGVTGEIPALVVDMMKQRELARNGHRWRDADSIRAQAKQLGYRLDDTASGQQASKL